MNTKLFRYSASVLLGILLTGATAIQARAAERIYARYAFLERSISVESLEVYAREGRFTDNLKTYGRFFEAEQLQQIRQGLLTPVDLNSLTIAQFLYTPIGERLLQRVSAVVRPRSGIEGDRALRSALILAAAEPDGLTPLNVLKKYPTQGLQVDLGVGLELFDEIQTLVEQTQQVSLAIETEATKQAASLDFDINRYDGLGRPGAYAWEKTSFEFRDDSEKRVAYTGRSQPFPLDLYLPKTNEAGPHPIVVISHGLNSSRASFDYLAEHLASHGYAVMVPEHPGSSRDQLNALLSGQANDVINRTEFLDRPLDISHALDELQRQAQTEFTLKNRLDFDRVGVIGQSFGGYTALALSGATLNFEQLKADCDVNLDNTFNLSLLLQCLALRLEIRNYELSDPRIKGAIVLNPIGSSLFGPQGIGNVQIPTMVVGGSSDTVAPLLPEQIQPYGWLTNPERYFVMVNGGTHFSFINSETSSVDEIPELQQFLGQRPDIAQSYLKNIGLAFVNRHVAGQGENTEILTSGHGIALSRQPLPLSILKDLPESGATTAEQAQP